MGKTPWQLRTGLLVDGFVQSPVARIYVSRNARKWSLKELEVDNGRRRNVKAQVRGIKGGPMSETVGPERPGPPLLTVALLALLTIGTAPAQAQQTGFMSRVCAKGEHWKPLLGQSRRRLRIVLDSTCNIESRSNIGLKVLKCRLASPAFSLFLHSSPSACAALYTLCIVSVSFLLRHQQLINHFLLRLLLRCLHNISTHPSSYSHFLTGTDISSLFLPARPSILPTT